MNTPKWTKEVPNRRPDPFNAIRVNLANAIRIVISHPLIIFMTDHTVWTLKTVIPTPTISIDKSISVRELMHMNGQRLFIRVMNHTQSNITTLTPKCANHRWTVVGIGAVSSPFGAAPTGRVFRVSMPIPFLTRILEHLIVSARLSGKAELGCTASDCD